jgi:hypothetical protein
VVLYAQLEGEGYALGVQWMLTPASDRQASAAAVWTFIQLINEDLWV